MMACCERKWDRNLDFGERFRSAFSSGWRHSALTTSANSLSTKTGSMKNTGTHGLQNVAANFAFDKSQSYFNDRVDLKIAGSFLIGSFGGLAQSGIMKERTGARGDFGRFGKLFGLSTFAYLGEYAANYMWNSSSRPPGLSFSSYYGYKQASYGIKSMFYTYLNW